MVDRRWGAGAPWAEQIALGSGVVFVLLALIAFLRAPARGEPAASVP